MLLGIIIISGHSVAHVHGSFLCVCVMDVGCLCVCLYANNSHANRCYTYLACKYKVMHRRVLYDIFH